MRILFLSNFYPPDRRAGGYGQWCREVSEILKDRGHTVGVLTSIVEGETAPAGEDNVYRHVHLENDDLLYYQPVRFFTRRRRQERQDLATTQHVLDEFSPDLVFVWGMWAMSRTIPAATEQRDHLPVVYYVSDHWPSDADMHTHYWTLPANHAVMRLPKRLLAWLALRILAAEGKPVTLRFDHAICVSAAVRDNLVSAGLAPFQKARVIHGGTDAARFSHIAAREPSTPGDRNPALLYAGRLVEQKGVHTAIEAIAQLIGEEGLTDLRLTIVGSGRPDYERLLRDTVRQQGVENHVVFHGPVSAEDMPGVMRNFDILVFPSVYEEPLARMTQEAMLSGLVVVGTRTGGTKEILEHGVNGLTFAPEDAGGLARQIKRLAADPGLRRRLAEAGRRTVLEGFTLTRMVDEIEAHLEDVVQNPQPHVQHA